MYKKLDLGLSFPSIRDKSIRIVIGNKIIPTIGYYDFTGNIKEEFISIIPPEYREDFSISTMEITKFIPPHTDDRILCNINYYFQTNSERTVFYKVKNKDISYQLPFQTNGKLYKSENITEVGSFIAVDGDVYVLDVTKIHSVIPKDYKERYRKAIVLSTSKFSYDEVSEMLKQYVKK